jgi:hypothetical protein
MVPSYSLLTGRIFHLMMMRYRQGVVTSAIRTALSVLFCLGLSPLAYAGNDWLPISSDELKMTSEPNAPGAAAIFLYRQVDRNDVTNREVTYERIKILTEEGREYANVQIPFLKQRDDIKDIRARTIQPDGSISNLDKKVYEQTIVKAKGLKYLAKTFAMPDVRVGSIIEYRYTDEITTGYIYDSYWALNADLFTKLARFSLKAGQLTLRWSYPNGLPPGTKPPTEDHGVIRMETQNVPAFQVEDYMPPEREVKFRVDFVYEQGKPESDARKFWEKRGKSEYKASEAFLNKRNAMEKALSTIVQPGDEAQIKLQKIYARVQGLNNYSYSLAKTEQELKREKRREIENVEDIWKGGGGNGTALNYLFVGLVRAAGMSADVVGISTRDQYFFNVAMMNPSQLNNNVVLVGLDGHNLFFDPGTAHLPYSLLPWGETGVKGLRPGSDGGSWVRTPMPGSAETKIEHKADLRLSEDGALEGELKVTYTGLEAFQIRIDGNDEDEAGRRKILEDAVRETIPRPVDVELINKPDWTGSASTFIAEYKLKMHDWTTGAGHRVFLPTDFFSAVEKQVFDHAERTHPVYFHYFFTKSDDVSVTVPAGWKIGSLPAPADRDATSIAYSNKIVDDQGKLHISRTLKSEILSVGPAHYSGLREFFQFVRSSDEQQIVLQHGG